MLLTFIHCIGVFSCSYTFVLGRLYSFLAPTREAVGLFSPSFSFCPKLVNWECEDLYYDGRQISGRFAVV